MIAMSEIDAMHITIHCETSNNVQKAQNLMT